MSWAASITAWCLGVGGHSSDGDGGDGDSSGDGDARGRIPEVQRYMMLTKRGYTWSTTLAPAQPLNSSLAHGLCCGGKWEREPCWAH